MDVALLLVRKAQLERRLDWLYFNTYRGASLHHSPIASRRGNERTNSASD
jgi:hypothetical protein